MCLPQAEVPTYLGRRISEIRAHNRGSSGHPTVASLKVLVGIGRHRQEDAEVSVPTALAPALLVAHLACRRQKSRLGPAVAAEAAECGLPCREVAEGEMLLDVSSVR